mmetsp:Transcript_67193/g.132529  ORF Transcript_67193/g.132529 Transcript_67193/m.132529 type:complete len:101 (-) Transcript_67193:111-413(-)
MSGLSMHRFSSTSTSDAAAKATSSSSSSTNWMSRNRPISQALWHQTACGQNAAITAFDYTDWKLNDGNKIYLIGSQESSKHNGGNDNQSVCKLLGIKMSC